MAYTTYYVVGPSSGWSDPTATEIKSGQLSGGGAATASGSEASLGSSGTHTFATPASGLSANTAYKIAFVASDGSTDSNVVVSSAFQWNQGAASGNEVTTSSIVGSSLFNGVLSGNEVTTSSIVGASTHNAVSSGNAVVASSVIGASTFDGVAYGNAVVTSSIVGDSVAAGSAVASGNAVVTSSIIGASVFNGIALGDIVVTGSFVGQGANTAGAASGAIVVTGGFVGQGATSTTLTSADLDAIWDVELETGYTARQMMRIMFAALAGKRSGLGTSTESYYDVATGSTVRISLTPDQNGNGTPVVDGT